MMIDSFLTLREQQDVLKDINRLRKKMVDVYGTFVEEEGNTSSEARLYRELSIISRTIRQRCYTFQKKQLDEAREIPVIHTKLKTGDFTYSKDKHFIIKQKMKFINDNKELFDKVIKLVDKRERRANKDITMFADLARQVLGYSLKTFSHDIICSLNKVYKQQNKQNENSNQQQNH